MKMIHCADLHLDSRMESNLSGEKAAERREELLSSFIRMVEYARAEGVSAVIIAGDLFDTSRSTQKRIKNRVLDQIRCAGDIDFLYLRGNHDQVDFFDTLEEPPSNLKLFNESWTTYHYGEADITGCELPKGRAASAPQRSGRNGSGELPGGRTASPIHALVLDRERLNIVVLHGQESKYDRKNDAAVINLTALQNRGIDYLALGHIHSYKCERLDSRGVYCYSGCLEGRGFDECGEKGFVLLDIEGGRVKHTFIPHARRLLHEIPVKLDGILGEGEIVNLIEDSIASIPPKDLVKIVLEGEVDEQTDIDLNYLRNRFEDRFYFLKIADHTRLMIKYEDYAGDISLKGEFIRLVQAQDMDEEDKKSVILLGLKALAGRETDI